jgi:hypothetical protein
MGTGRLRTIDGALELRPLAPWDQSPLASELL